MSEQLQPRSNPNAQVFGAWLVVVICVSIVSWKASEYVNDNRRTYAENIMLRTNVTELEKTVEKLEDRLRDCDGLRPVKPIGNPAGSTQPTGSAK